MPDPTSSLSGRLCLVTGAGGAIGEAIAAELLRAQASVVLNDVDEERVNLAAERLAAQGNGRPHTAVADVSDPDAVTSMIRAIREQHGPVDVLVNNAGIVTRGTFLSCSVEDWNRMLGVNVMGPVLCTRAVVPEMKRRRWGRVIMISSMLGVSGAPHLVSYAATKAALHGIVKSLAREVGGSGITVNAVAPGLIATEMSEGYLSASSEAYREQTKQLWAFRAVDRLLTPDDVAHAVRFLCMDASDAHTGQIIQLDGGLY